MEKEEKGEREREGRGKGERKGEIERMEREE